MSDMPSLHALLGVHDLPAQLPNSINANLYRQAVQQMQLGNTAQARQLCEQLLAQNKDAPDVLHLLGLIAFQEKDHTQAIAHLARVIELQPDNADASFNLGQILLFARQYGQAEKHFAHVLQLVPDMVSAQLGLAQALAYQGRHDSALQHLKHVIAKKEMLSAADAALALMHKGMLCGGDGRHLKALQLFEQAISLNPQLVPAHYGQANALRALGRLAEAEKSIKQIFVLDDRYAPAYFLFGTLLEKTRQYTEALRCFDRAILLSPEFSDAHDGRRRILQALGFQGQAGSSDAYPSKVDD